MPIAASSLYSTAIDARACTGRWLSYKATGRAQLSKASSHVLRHTFASILIAQGRHVAFVSQQLGHTDPGFTLRAYIHLFCTARGTSIGARNLAQRGLVKREVARSSRAPPM